MKLHTKFIDQLGKKRKATVGEIIKDLDILTIDGNSIQDLNDNLDQLDQIFYTAHYLLKNDLVIQESFQFGNNVPDFNPTNFLSEEDESTTIYYHMHTMPRYLNHYWGREFFVLPAYFEMIVNGYKTNQEKKEFWNFWLPFISALLAAVATGLFTQLFELWLK